MTISVQCSHSNGMIHNTCRGGESTKDVFGNVANPGSARQWNRTHRGGNVDEERVAVDAHRLQKGVASDLPLGPLPPGQETPQTYRDQPGVQEDDHCSDGHCGRETRASQRDWTELRAGAPGARVGPTSVKLWSVVVRGVPPLTEERGQVPPDGH